MKTKIFSLFFVIVLALAACGSGSNFQQNQDQGESQGSGSNFQQNQKKWESQGINHYRFTIAVSCFCPFANVEVTYEVQNGQVVNQTIKTSPDNPVDEAQVKEFYQSYNTIEKVFDYVREAVNEADDTTIEYDQNYGFPRTVSIDWIELATDDEIYLTISAFEPLS